MNLKNIQNMYAPDLDVRRIDMCIGEKSCWGKGIGALLIRMLAKYAFECENAHVLHCLCEDYNIRSRRVWEKNGFSLILKEDTPGSVKARQQYHYRLTREEYFRKKA